MSTQLQSQYNENALTIMMMTTIRMTQQYWQWQQQTPHGIKYNHNKGIKTYIKGCINE